MEFWEKLIKDLCGTAHFLIIFQICLSSFLWAVVLFYEAHFTTRKSQYTIYCLSITVYPLVKDIFLPLKHQLTNLKVCNFLIVSHFLFLIVLKCGKHYKTFVGWFSQSVKTVDLFVWESRPAKYTSSNGMSLGAAYLFGWPMEDEGSVWETCSKTSQFCNSDWRCHEWWWFWFTGKIVVI